VCRVGKKILVVGIADKGNALKELPVQILALNVGAQAIRCLREERIDAIVSHWELIDMPDGNFLKKVTEAKPSMPTIAFIMPGDIEQELAARQIGVDCVLSEDIDDDYFREAVCQLLGIPAVSSLQITDGYRS
jgi:DNA-binding NarL/FixJ family response regulator